LLRLKKKKVEVIWKNYKRKTDGSKTHGVPKRPILSTCVPVFLFFLKKEQKNPGKLLFRGI
jgi:hypothetical protein